MHNTLPQIIRIQGKESAVTVKVLDSNINYKTHIIDAKIHTTEGTITLSEAVVNLLYAQICDAHHFMKQERNK